MANKKHLAILRQGADAWNQWRRENPEMRPDLREASLIGANLQNFNFGKNRSLGWRYDLDISKDLSPAQIAELKATLEELSVRPSPLDKGMLIGHESAIQLKGIVLFPIKGKRRFIEEGSELTSGLEFATPISDAFLHEYLKEPAGTDFYHADLTAADLSHADLHSADLAWAHLSKSNLTNASLKQARLWFAEFYETELMSTDFDGAIFGWTKFANTNLAVADHLENTKHLGPSSIGVDTLIKSAQRIPEKFLRRAGLPESVIKEMSFFRGQKIQFYSCFISYSSGDGEFAELLYADLQDKGVRCWFAPEDLKIGDRFRTRIHESIRLYDKLLVVISENSIRSSWVEDEVEAALTREHRENREILFPIMLDGCVMETDQAWAESLRATRHIGDFRRWQVNSSYKKAFDRLLRDLNKTP